MFAVEVLGEAGLSVQERPIRDAADQAAWLAATLPHDATRGASLSLIDPACVLGRSP